MSEIVNQSNIGVIAETLAQRDLHLAEVLRLYGPPPLWKRPAGFATLVRIVLEQQVSLASAAATFERLRLALGGGITASGLRDLGDDQLKAIGFSRQKARYCRLLADRVVSRQFSVAALQRISDEQARRQITSLVGFGNWSADIYLLMALGRSNILPTGDLGLVVGLAELTGRKFEAVDQIEEYAKLWEPYRSVATRMVWQSYLVRRGKGLT